LGEGWNGAAWHAQPVPNPARAITNFLNGVSCPSSSDCTAAGNGNADGTAVSLGERWRDGRWNIEAVPSPVGAADNQLNGIDCPATHRCEAVGIVFPTRGAISAEALGWNGRTWRLQKTPAVPGANLNWVSCVSETDCLAVGASNAGTLAERWNGEDWTIQATPNPAGKAMAGFTGVSCTSASFCVAVGFPFDSAGNPVATLAERWNGKSWAIQPTPNPAPGSGFGGVSCTSASFCVAVGGGPAGVKTFGRAVERPELAHPAHPQPVKGRRPGRGVLHVHGRLHRGRGPRRGDAVERDEVDHPAHPQHRIARQPLQHCAVHVGLVLHGGRRTYRQLRTPVRHPGRAVERPELAHPAHTGSSRDWARQQLHGCLPGPIDLHRGRRVRKRRPRREDTDRSVAERGVGRPTRTGRLLAPGTSRHGWLHPRSHG